MSKFYTNVENIGNYIHVREINNGISSHRRVKYSPTLFVPVKKKTKYRTLNDEYLQPVDFEDIRSARDWIKQYEGVDNFQFYGMTRYAYQAIADWYPNLEYDFTKIKIGVLDIETEAEEAFPNPQNPTERVNLITLNKNGKPYSFGLGPYKGKHENVIYTECSSERELFCKFLDFWESDYIDILSGWSIKQFDIPYVINRIRVLFDEDGEKMVSRLSPFGKIKPDVYRYMTQETPTFSILGIAILDYIQLYKKFIPDPRENYKLGYICEVELEITKIDHSEYARFSDFYKNDWDKYVDYNIRDTELIFQLEDKLSLMAMIVETAYYCKCNYEDVLSQVRSWDCKVYNYLRDQGIQIPQMVFHDKDVQFEGAFVKEPKPGMYEWLVGFDFNSLYPNLARLLNIGAETKIKKYKLGVQDFLEKSEKFQIALEECKSENRTLGANGVSYSKERESFYSVLIGILFTERKGCQKKMKDAKKLLLELVKETEEWFFNSDIAKKMHISQYAKKIQLNSLYGCMGTIYWRFFDVDNAEAITLTGQVAIRFVSRKLNEYLNKIFKTEDIDFVIMNDTDSAVITLKMLVEKSGLDTKKDIKKIVDLLDKFAEQKLSKIIEDAINELVAHYFNGVPDVLKMARAEIASKGIWCAKKRYLMYCYNIEGIPCDPPKLKVTGLEIKKSTNPKFCRDSMEKAVHIIMDKNNDDLISYVDKVRKEFQTLNSHDISMPKGVHDLEKFTGTKENQIYTKGTPLHTRAALLYNKRILDLGLDTKYQKIQSHDKIRYVFLKLPNPIQENAIAFPDDLPKDFGLDEFIDYDLQFQKSFLDPLNIILNPISWSFEKKGNLSKFF